MASRASFLDASLFEGDTFNVIRPRMCHDRLIDLTHGRRAFKIACGLA